MMIWEKPPLHGVATLLGQVSERLGEGPWGRLGHQLALTLVFTAIGLAIFALAFWLISRVAPFSVRKEIEEDQNIALAIVIGAVILGIGLIIAAAIHGQ